MKSTPRNLHWQDKLQFSILRFFEQSIAGKRHLLSDCRLIPLCYWPTIHVLISKICSKFQVLRFHFSEVNDLLNEQKARKCAEGNISLCSTAEWQWNGSFGSWRSVLLSSSHFSEVNNMLDECWVKKFKENFGKYFKCNLCWMIKVWTLPVAPLWCDLGFFPNSRGNKAAANLRPTICFDERFAV